MENSPKIHPSILCADHGYLAENIKSLEEAGVDYFHMDVMDGDFVPNFGVGTEIIKWVRKNSPIPIDTHLMIRKPARHVRFFRELGSEIITIHPEADEHCAETLELIRGVGAVPGIAISPNIPVDAVRELLPLCGHVLAMTVEPGFGGQKFLDFTLEKLDELGKLAQQYGFSLCVDGNIDAERVRQLSPLGVTNFVIGTAMFRGDPRELIREIKGEGN